MGRLTSTGHRLRLLKSLIHHPYKPCVTTYEHYPTVIAKRGGMLRASIKEFEVPCFAIKLHPYEVAVSYLSS